MRSQSRYENYNKALGNTTRNFSFLHKRFWNCILEQQMYKEAWKVVLATDFSKLYLKLKKKKFKKIEKKRTYAVKSDSKYKKYKIISVINFRANRAKDKHLPYLTHSRNVIAEVRQEINFVNKKKNNNDSECPKIWAQH